MIRFGRFSSSRRTTRIVLLAVTAIVAWGPAAEQAQARRRLFHRGCQTSRPCCGQQPSYSGPRGDTYCPAYGGAPAGDLFLYYGMKYLGPMSCEGPPRPMYYETMLSQIGCVNTANCVSSYMLTRGHGCAKGYNKNESVPADVALGVQLKKTFKDQNAVEHKLHLFKVDVVLDGVTYVVGHGYGPRHGDADAYPLDAVSPFVKDATGYCGYLKIDEDGDGVTDITYFVILNRN